MLAIDAPRAQRAREVYDAALSKDIVSHVTIEEFGSACAIAATSAADSAEWIELENNGVAFNGRDCGVKHSNVPHKQSAYAHLPMRGITYGQDICHGTTPVMKQRAIALWPELSIGGKRMGTPTLVKKSAPHPGSYGTSFPLRGLGLEGDDPVRKWTLTASEKRELAARPLRYTRTAA
jgi:hypothetical protein